MDKIAAYKEAIYEEAKKLLENKDIEKIASSDSPMEKLGQVIGKQMYFNSGAVEH